MRDPWKGRHRLMIWFIVVGAIASYAGSLDTYFLKDDLSLGILTGGGHDFDAKSWFHQLVWPDQRNYDDIFRPIPPLSWAVDFLLFGPDPVAFHLWNVLFHALNGILLYWFVNRLTRFRNPLAGFFAGFLFVLYPLHGEALLWSTQRFVVWGLTFYLLALILGHAYVHRPTPGRFTLVWVAVFLATMTKELGVTLPGPLCLMALFAGPERPWQARFAMALRLALAGVLFIAAYFSLRHMIFGRLVGGYAGWPSMQDYARDNNVFERLPQTLLACAVPLNRALPAPSWCHPAFIILQSLAACAGVFGLVRGLVRSRDARVMVLVTIAVIAVTSLPTLWIFYVEPNLLNSRFGYHPMCFILALLAVGWVQPWSRSTGPLRWIVPGLLGVVYAATLQANLRAYDAGGAQVRQLQTSLANESITHPPSALHVVFNVPHERDGCPTIDLYLPALMRPPLLVGTTRAFPFVDGQQAAWEKQAVSERGLRSLLGRDPVYYYKASQKTGALTQVFGAEEPAQGDHPVDLEGPLDGSLLLADEPEPMFSWRGEPDRSYVLHIDVPGRSLQLVVKADSASGAVLHQRLSEGVLTVNGAVVPFVWPLPVGSFEAPVFPVQWRVEARDAEGRAVGISKSSRLLIFDTRLR